MYYRIKSLSGLYVFKLKRGEFIFTEDRSEAAIFTHFDLPKLKKIYPDHYFIIEVIEKQGNVNSYLIETIYKVNI